MKTTITLELLKRVHKEVGAELKKAIELEVPEVKGRLEANRWITCNRVPDWLIYYDIKNNKTYGFRGNSGLWYEINGKDSCFNDIENRYATPEEVETALIAEAIRRGFEEGITHTVTNGENLPTAKSNRFAFDEIPNKLLFNNWSIFQNGTWATIITEPTEKELLIEKLNELKEKAIELETQINQMK